MIPLAAIERIARKAGADRISSDALKELGKITEEIALDLAYEAAEAARHAKRKTILKQDIKIVSRKP
jgi:histone H3/H4